MVLCLVGWSKCFWATPLRIKVDCNADFPKSSKSGFVDSKHAQIHRTHQQTTRELAAYLSLRLAKTELQNIILKARYIGRRELRSAPVWPEGLMLDHNLTSTATMRSLEL